MIHSRWLLALPLGLAALCVEAFLTPFQQPAVYHAPRQWSRLLSMVEDDVDTDARSRRSREPHPPDYPPPNLDGDLSAEYESLSAEALQSGARLEALENQVNDLQQQLSEKQKELDRSRDDWSMERTSLIARIAEMTGLLGSRKDDDEDLANEKDRLEREVELLQDQMNQAMNALKAEQRTTEQVRARLADVEDALEFQQMEFEDAKKALEQQVSVERKKLTDIQSTWEADKKRFIEERTKIEQQLSSEKKRLAEAEEQRQKNQVDFEEQEATLKSQLTETKESLKARTNELAVEKADAIKERAALQKQIEEEQARLREVETTLQQEQIRFMQLQAELESKIEVEQKKVAELTDRLANEQKRFDAEKDRLETRIEEERERLQQVEDRLAAEQLSFAERESKLENQLSEEIRIRKLKKRQMNERYEAIRSELTALWEGSKRDARKREQQLTKKYEKQLADMRSATDGLQAELSKTRSSNANLETLLADVRKDKDKALADAKDMENRYIAVVAQRNKEIENLRTNLDKLRASVQTKEEQLEKVSGSYRQLLRLSIDLTGRRIKGSGERVGRIFRRKK